MSAYLRGVDLEVVLGGEMTRVETPEFERQMKDLSARVRQMARLKNVTVSIARTLLQGGQAAVDDAVREAARTRSLSAWAYLPTVPSLLRQIKVSQIPPTDASRQKVYWKLRWHQDRIDEMAKTPDAPYPHANDLKNWVAQAFVERAVAEDERAFIDKIWSAMWGEIGEKVADYARRLGAVAAAPFLLVEKALSVPKWIWIGGAVLIVGALGFGVYKIALAAAPAAGAAAFGRYLPPRRA